jgi:hypothetical protein
MGHLGPWLSFKILSHSVHFVTTPLDNYFHWFLSCDAFLQSVTPSILRSAVTISFRSSPPLLSSFSLQQRSLRISLICHSTDMTQPPYPLCFDMLHYTAVPVKFLYLSICFSSPSSVLGSRAPKYFPQHLPLPCFQFYLALLR